jgi:hypothetical protein
MEMWLFTHPLWIIHVPNSLEHFSLYEFTSTHKKIVSVEQLLFKKPHLQWASHSLKAQTLKCIVNVYEVQLPNIS